MGIKEIYDEYDKSEALSQSDLITKVEKDLPAGTVFEIGGRKNFIYSYEKDTANVGVTFLGELVYFKVDTKTFFKVALISGMKILDKKLSESYCSDINLTKKFINIA